MLREGIPSVHFNRSIGVEEVLDKVPLFWFYFPIFPPGALPIPPPHFITQLSDTITNIFTSLPPFLLAFERQNAMHGKAEASHEGRRKKERLVASRA